MKYQITVMELLPDEKIDSRYPNTKEIYQQIVDDLDVPGLVNWINRPARKEVVDIRQL